MEKLSFQPAKLLPGIVLDKETGKFQIVGTSCPEDAVEFYDPVFQWLDEYSVNPLKSTVFDFRLSYFNTVSAKILLMIMSKMETLSCSGHEVKIRWFFREGDDDLEEAGEEFESIVDCEFEMIPIYRDISIQKDDDFFDQLFNELV